MQVSRSLRALLLKEQIACRPNHGLMTMYEFGETIGSLERCYYFGHGKDLYHFDHFMGESFCHLQIQHTLTCICLRSQD